MRTPVLIFATVLLSSTIVRSQDEQLKALCQRAAPKYREEFNKLVESGSLEPDEATLQVKADFSSEAFQHRLELDQAGMLHTVSPLQRRLYLAGYYSAVMEFIEPDTSLSPPVKTTRHGFILRGPKSIRLGLFARF